MKTTLLTRSRMRAFPLPSTVSSRRQIQLSKGAVWHSERGERASQFQCVRGVCWLTWASDPQDHILQAGDSMEVSSREGMVVQALEDAVFTLD